MSARTTPAVRHGVSLQTADATETIVATLQTAADTAYHVRARFIGFRPGAPAANIYTLEAGFKNVGGTLTQVGSTATGLSVEDAGSWGSPALKVGTDDPDTDPDEAQQIQATVTGAAETTIDWRVDLEILELAAST